MKGTFKLNILEAANGEEIVAFKFLDHKISKYSKKEDVRNVSKVLNNKIISWGEAAPLVDYEFNNCYGGEDCHNVVFWTQKYVFYIYEYDGSTEIHEQLRNPE